MIAYYDLSRCPPTFDVVVFLALAELERQRRGEEYIDVIILPGPREGFRADHHWPHDTAGRVHMRDNVLVPLCRLLPSVRSVEVANRRRGEGWGHGEYHVGLPNIMKALKAGCRPLRCEMKDAPPTLRDKKLVTITLRESEHHQLRNSRVEEWVKAAHTLKKMGFLVQAVRDTQMAGRYLEDVPTFIEASRELRWRAWLYQHAGLNAGISNGPMWMSIFMDAPTLMLRPTTNEAGGCYDDWFFAEHGLPHGSQLPTSQSHQRLVWQEDTCDNIVRAVEEMLG